MLHTILLSTMLAQNSACSGPDLAITSARVVKVVRRPGVANAYTISVTAKNEGASEPSSALQFVDVSEHGQKIDDKGVPPLRTGQTYSYRYAYARSRSAGTGTTVLVFSPDVRSGGDCNPDSGSFRLRF